MKVLFISRVDALTRPGGDTVQLQKTKQGLERRGVNVRIGDIEESQFEWADIIHVFNAQTPERALPALKMAKNKGKKVALSTIWWDLKYARLAYQLNRLNVLPNKFNKNLINPSNWLFSVKEKEYLSNVAIILDMADILLPNSEEEMKILSREFNLRSAKYFSVPNAVDDSVFSYSNHEGSGVICVARIEPTKNQLNLIKAMPENTRLTLVGQGDRNSSYYKSVERLAYGSDVKIISDHKDQGEIAHLLGQHKVHALPSFRESPGLSSLEALSVGLNVVVSDKIYCPVDTYFGSYLNKYAFVCDPFEKVDISRALANALEVASPSFEDTLAIPHWDEVAEKTLAAYHFLR